MVINSAQNAGKEFMLFQAVSMKQEAQVSKDSFSAIFNNVTGRSNLFANDALTAAPKLQKPDTAGSDNDKLFINSNVNGKQQVNGKQLKDDKDSDIFADKADAIGTAEAVDTEDGTEEDFIEKAASFLFQVTVTVTVVLSVSMDELQQSMQELGMMPTDLLNADSRYSLFVNLKAEGDAANLLKDNALVDMLNTMENQIADLFATEGITPESFDKVLKLTMDTVADTANEVLNQFMSAVSEEPVKSRNEVKVDEKGEQTVVIDGIENAKAPKVEVSAESQNDSANKNNTESSKKEKEPVKPLEVSNKFVDHLVNTFETKFQLVKASEAQYVPDMREIVSQILEQVKIHVNNANTSIEIQLTPEALGKVHVSVEDNNGILTAKFQAESRVAKEAIESNLIQFKEHLAEQGIKVDSVEVSVGNFDFTGHQFGQGKGQEAESHVKKHFEIEGNGGAQMPTEDLKEAAYIESGTSTVSFTA